MRTELKVEHVADSDIDDTKEALVAPLELALIEYLHRDDGGILDSAMQVGYEKSWLVRESKRVRPTYRSSRSSRGSRSFL